MSRDEPRVGLTVESKVARDGMVAEGTLILRTALLEVVRESTLEAMKKVSTMSLLEGTMFSWSESATTSRRSGAGDGIQGGWFRRHCRKDGRNHMSESCKVESTGCGALTGWRGYGVRAVWHSGDQRW